MVEVEEEVKEEVMEMTTRCLELLVPCVRKTAQLQLCAKEGGG